MEHRRSEVSAEPELPARRAHTIAVTSGKGGVGKSNIALNLAIGLAEMDATVCLLDANMGLGNIDLMCGLNGYWNLSHVVTGARSLREIILKGPGDIDVVPGASGLCDIAACPPEAQQDIFGQLDELEANHDYIVIDTGTGIHKIVRQFVTAADIALVVTTTEPTSIADAYATIKSLSTADVEHLEVVINQINTVEQGRAINDRLQQTAKLFLKTKLASGAGIPHDPNVPLAVAQRKPFLVHAPQCPASRAIRQLARRIRTLTGVKPARGTFFPSMRKGLHLDVA